MNNKPRDNEFMIRIANVNGTGSASANALLMKSLFRMGIPVSGKNYFPSNIQGLPTWYEIRVSGSGRLARTRRCDIMAAMNAQTYQKDLTDCAAGGYLIYDSTWPRNEISLEVSESQFLTELEFFIGLHFFGQQLHVEFRKRSNMLFNLLPACSWHRRVPGRFSSEPSPISRRGSASPPCWHWVPRTRTR